MKLFIVLLALSCLIALVRAGSTNNARNSPTEDKRNYVVKSGKVQWKANNLQRNEKRKAGKRKAKNSNQYRKTKKQKRKTTKSTLRGKRKEEIGYAKRNKKENIRRKISENSTKSRDVKGKRRKVNDPNQKQKQKGKRRKPSKNKKTGRKTNRSKQRKRKYTGKRKQSNQAKRLKEMKGKTRNMKKTKRKTILHDKGKNLGKKMISLRQNKRKSKSKENSGKRYKNHPTRFNIKTNNGRKRVKMNLKKNKLKKKSEKRKMSTDTRQLKLDNDEEQIFIRTLRNRVRRWFNWGVRQYERSLSRMRSMRNKADNSFQFVETHSLLFEAVGESALMCTNLPYRNANRQIMVRDLTTLDQCRERLELNCPTLTFPTGWEAGEDCTKINDDFIKVHDSQVDKVVNNTISTRQYIDEITILDTNWRENNNFLQTTCSSITQFTRDIRSQNSKCSETNSECKDTAVRAARHIFNCRNTCEKTMQEIIIQNINIDVTNTGNCINNLYCFGGECEQVQFEASGVESSNQDNCNANRRQIIANVNITEDNNGACINNVICFGGGCDQSQFDSNGDNSTNTNNCNNVTTTTNDVTKEQLDTGETITNKSEFTLIVYFFTPFDEM